MFKIDQHIELLLLNHSCVIVPGFGGFVVHNIPAHFDESDGMMLPPSITVGFNPQLIINDSLLVQSFAETYDMSYPEAQREVERETQELRGLIADNGQFEIHSIGTLILNADGKYEFEPCEAGILTPRLYGLSGIETQDEDIFLPTKTSQPQKAVAAPLAEVTNEEDENVIEEDDNLNEETISIRRSTLHKVAAACAAILLLIAIPFLATGGNTQKILSGIDLSFFTNLMPKTEVKKAEVPVKKETYHVYINKKSVSKAEKESNTEPIQNVENKEVNVNVKTETTTTKKELSEPSYTIVLAAQVSRSNAEIYVNDLKVMGIKDARIIGEGKSRKVVTGTYSTEEEAKHARRDLAKKADFSTAWVMKMK